MDTKLKALSDLINTTKKYNILEYVTHNLTLVVSMALILFVIMLFLSSLVYDKDYTKNQKLKHGLYSTMIYVIVLLVCITGIITLTSKYDQKEIKDAIKPFIASNLSYEILDDNIYIQKYSSASFFSMYTTIAKIDTTTGKYTSVSVTGLQYKAIVNKMIEDDTFDELQYNNVDTNMKDTGTKDDNDEKLYTNELSISFVANEKIYNYETDSSDKVINVIVK